MTVRMLEDGEDERDLCHAADCLRRLRAGDELTQDDRDQMTVACPDLARRLGLSVQAAEIRLARQADA